MLKWREEFIKLIPKVEIRPLLFGEGSAHVSVDEIKT